MQGILGVIQIIVYLSCKLKNTPPLIFTSAYMTLEEQKLHLFNKGLTELEVLNGTKRLCV